MYGSGGAGNNGSTGLRRHSSGCITTTARAARTDNGGVAQPVQQHQEEEKRLDALKFQQLQAQALTSRIGGCRSAVHLAALLSRCRRHLNSIHVAAALTRLAELQVQEVGAKRVLQSNLEDEGRAAAAAAAAAAVQAVVSRCIAHIAAACDRQTASVSRIRPRELSTSLWALARLDSTTPPPPAVWSQLLSYAQSSGSGLSPHDASITTWALAQLKTPPPPGWMEQWVMSLLPAVGTYPARSLIVLLQALAQLGRWPLPPAAAAPLLTASSAVMSSLSSRDVAMLLWSVTAGLRLQPPTQWMAGWLRASLRTVPDMTANELTAACVALAQGRFRPPAGWMKRLHGQLYWTADQFEGPELAAVAWALGRLQASTPVELSQRLLGYGVIKLAELSKPEGDSVDSHGGGGDGGGGPSNHSSTPSGSSSSSTSTTTSSSSSSTTTTTPPPLTREVALLLHAHATLRLPLEGVPGGPELHWHLLRTALPQSGPQAFAMCMWSLATQGYRLQWQGGLDLLAARLTQLAPSMTPSGLSISAWAMARLGAAGGAAGGRRSTQWRSAHSNGGRGRHWQRQSSRQPADDEEEEEAEEGRGQEGSSSTTDHQAAATEDEPDKAWVQAVVARSQQLMAQTDARELSALLVAFKLLRATPPIEWTAAAGGRLTALAPTMPGRAVVKALDALAALRIVPSRRLLAALSARVEVVEVERGLSFTTLDHCQRHLAALQTLQAAAMQRVEAAKQQAAGDQQQ